jgi:hypothetical protein
VLVVTVRGELGERIQSWRERYDPKHAARLPPHLTVCYRPPADAPLEFLEAQVRHAFTTPVRVLLGPVFVLQHREAPLAVGVHQTSDLDASRKRLYDGTHVQMGGREEWPWHITCVRYGYNKDRDALLSAAASELCLNTEWTIHEVSCLELIEKQWRPIADWQI